MADNNKRYSLPGLTQAVGAYFDRLKQKGRAAGKDTVNGGGVSAASIKAGAISLIKKAAIVLVSYLLGSSSALFTTYPFGLPFLCASTKNILFVYIGLVFAACTIRGEASAFFLIYTACLIMRYAFSRWIYGKKEASEHTGKIGDRAFAEPLSLRLITLIVCSLSVSLARLISDGFLYYDLFGMIVCVIFSAVLFLAYYYPLNRINISAHLLRLCAAVFVYSIVYALKDYYILNFSAGVLAAFLVTMYVTKKSGVLCGCMFGLFAGLACKISYAPLFALTGFVFGTLEAYSLFMSAAAAFLTALFFGIVSDGFAAFSTLLPELALGSAVFLPLAYYNLLPQTRLFAPEGLMLSADTQSAVINRERLRDSRDAFEAISASFATLSTTIAALSDRLRRPDVLDIKSICEQGFEKHCKKCSLAGICYGRDYSYTCDVMGKFTSALDKKGRIDMSDVPEHVADKCFNILKIVSELNLSYAKHLEGLIRIDKLSAFAIDYKALSKLIHDTSVANEEEYEIDRERTKRLAEALRYMDIDADGVFVYGKRRLRLAVTGIRLSHMKLGTPELRAALENVCGAYLSPPTFEIDGERVSMSAQSERVFDITVAKASEKMQSSEVCGDSSLSFEGVGERVYFLISDGMGSGREAAMTSRLCTVFLSKLLSAGCDKAIVLELLNGFLRSKNDECCSSIDLAELDLLAGKGCFIKSGAAPSYILRDKNLYKLQSRTLPIGILKDTDAELINFELCDGDVIVMFSDGVASSLEDSVWLTSLLCFDFDEDLDKMAAKILEYAKKDNRKTDDMTVALIQVNKRSRE